MALDLKEAEIIVHVWKREKLHSQLYVVNLGTGCVSNFPGRGVGREDASCKMVASADLIYLIGNSRPFDPKMARSPSDMLNYGYPRFSPDRPRTKAGWSFDFSNMNGIFDFLNMNGWKEVPNYKSFSHHPRCVSLKDNIYLFGGGIRETRDGPLLSLSPGEVYDPRHRCWKELPLPQLQQPDPDLDLGSWMSYVSNPPLADHDNNDSASWMSYVSNPPLADHDNNRLLVHFTHIDFLYAYYPDDLKWVRLFPIPASSWDSLSVVVDGMILIHDPDNDTHFSAFDLTVGKWLNACLSVSVPDFNYNLLYWEYDALFPLTPPATFCLAKNLQFLIFTAARSSSGDPLITVFSAVSLPLHLPSIVHNYLPMGERQARLLKTHKLKRSKLLISEIRKMAEKCRDRHA